MSEPWIGWHFLPEDGRLQYGERVKVEVGETLRHDGPVVLCQSGFHAAKRAIDALGYAPGPIACVVRLSGTILDDTDKSVASERTVLAMADATKVLHEFACRCAEQALKTAKIEDVRCWKAIETKRKWLRGEATDEELAAARDAAMAAAWDAAMAAAGAAAWDAAMDTAGAAAWDAAREAAGAAARDAAREAARAAARAAQNTMLTEMLSDLLAEAIAALERGDREVVRRYLDSVK